MYSAFPITFEFAPPHMRRFTPRRMARIVPTPIPIFSGKKAVPAIRATVLPRVTDPPITPRRDAGTRPGARTVFGLPVFFGAKYEG